MKKAKVKDGWHRYVNGHWRFYKGGCIFADAVKQDNETWKVTHWPDRHGKSEPYYCNTIHECKRYVSQEIERYEIEKLSDAETPVASVNIERE